MTKMEQKRRSARVTRCFNAGCSGVQVGVMDLSKVNRVGLEGIDAGDDDAALTARIKAFVETIRKN